jgi:hypothetical protein
MPCFVFAPGVFNPNCESPAVDPSSRNAVFCQKLAFPQWFGANHSKRQPGSNSRRRLPFCHPHHHTGHNASSKKPQFNLGLTQMDTDASTLQRTGGSPGG